MRSSSLPDAAGVLVGSREELLVKVLAPPPERLAQRKPAAFEQRQRPYAVRVAQREVDRDLAAVAATDHDRRRKRECVDQRRSIVGLLPDVRDERLRALAPREPAPVVQDGASMLRQRVGRVTPEG